MKNVILIISLFTFSVSYSQIEYVDVDWVIDQTQVMSNGQSDTVSIDFDQDGVDDMRITSWSNHSSGIQTVVEALMLNSSLSGGLEVPFNPPYISDCPSTGFQYDKIVGYIYTSDFSNPYSGQYVKIPFRFEGFSGTHFGLLYVRYQGSLVTIEGYAWNPTPNGACSCSNTGWLSIQELTQDKLEIDKYFNLLGQEIKDPHGFVIVLYKNGITKKMYIE